MDIAKQVVSDECSGCVDCVDVCPVPGALGLGLIGSRRKISKKVWVYAFVLVFWGALIFFKWVGPWGNSISTQEYIYHSQRMNGGEYTHPGR